MEDETEEQCFARVMQPLISHASDEELGRMVTGPDRDFRPAKCASRQSARIAGIELAMRATGERTRVVYVPTEVRNARSMVALLRSGIAAGKAMGIA